jgi:hypothetical protein
MKIFFAITIVVTLIFSPWEEQFQTRPPRTVISPIWDAPVASELRIDVIAVEWVGLGLIYLALSGRKPRPADGEAVD